MGTASPTRLIVTAVLCTVIALREGEADPLFYLVDELGAQHELPASDLPATELLPDPEPDADPTDGEEDR